MALSPYARGRSRGWHLLLRVSAGLMLAAATAAAPQPSRGNQAPAAAGTTAVVSRARNLLQSGDAGGALAMLEHGPDSSEVHVLRGICFAMLEKPIESTAEFDRAIALSPRSAAIYLSAGLAAARFNNLNRAAELLAEALRLEPALPGLRYNYALVLARAGRFAESEDQVDRELGSAGAREEPPANLWNLKAHDAYAQKKWQDTITAYQEVVSVQPDSAAAYAALGEAFYALNRSQESETALRKAIALDASDGNTHRLLGKLYQDEGKREEAIAQFEAAIRLNAEDREAVYRLLRIYSSLGDRENVARLQKQLQVMSASNMTESTNEAKATELNNRGIELEKAGDLAGALADYDQAAQTDAVNIIFQRNAALLLCKMGRAQEAIRRLRDILSLEPDDAETLQILAVADEVVSGNRAGRPNFPSPQASR